MSPITKVKMSPWKGQESGHITHNERQRNHTVGNHAEDQRSAAEPKRGRLLTGSLFGKSGFSEWLKKFFWKLSYFVPSFIKMV